MYAITYALENFFLAIDNFPALVFHLLIIYRNISTHKFRTLLKYYKFAKAHKFDNLWEYYGKLSMWCDTNKFWTYGYWHHCKLSISEKILMEYYG